MTSDGSPTLAEERNGGQALGVGRVTHVAGGGTHVVFLGQGSQLATDEVEFWPGEGGDDGVAVEGAVVADVHGVGQHTDHLHPLLRLVREHGRPGVAHGRVTPDVTQKHTRAIV